MNPNFASDMAELRKKYTSSKSIYLQRSYSYKSRVRQCTFTNSLLTKPVVMCRKGFLFNRDSLLKALFKKNLPSRLNYISTVSDVCDVELNLNKNKKNKFPFCCPLTAKVLNGANPFVLIWSCGCLMYEKLLFPLAGIKVSLDEIEKYQVNRTKVQKEYERLDYKCPNCRKSFALKDIFSLNLSSKKKNSGNNLKKKKESLINLKQPNSPIMIKPNLIGKRELPKINLNFNIDINVKQCFKKIKKKNQNIIEINSAKSQNSKKASENRDK